MSTIRFSNARYKEQNNLTRVPFIKIKQQIEFFSWPASPPCLSIEFSDAIIKLEESVSYVIFFSKRFNEVNLFTMIGGGINITELVEAGLTGRLNSG